MAVLTYQIHKRSVYEYKYIQDKFAVSNNAKIFAISDGTTQSFRSEIWAHILVNEFIKKPVFEKEKLIQNFKLLVPEFKKVDFEYNKNPALASLEKYKLLKGSTATFLAIKFIDNYQIECISCGDSNLFIYDLNKSEIIEAFPSTNIEELDSQSGFINTEIITTEEFDDSNIFSKKITVNENSILILATDALSRLFLKEPQKIQEFISISSFDELKSFSILNWENKLLQEDDITALVLKNINEEVSHIFPPNDFTFPKEEEKEFIPTSITENIIEFQSLNNKEMNQISENLFRILDGNNKIRKSITSTTIYLFLIVTLCLMNLLLAAFILFDNSNKSTNTRNSQSAEIINLNDQLKEKEGEIQRLKYEINKNSSVEVSNKENNSEKNKSQNLTNKHESSDKIKKPQIIEPKKTDSNKKQ